MFLKTLNELGINTDFSSSSLYSYDRNPFEPIAIGKPLLIRFHTIYLGDIGTNIFKSKKDILVCSAIKDDSTFEAAPRAINQLYHRQTGRQLLSPSALNKGTPIMYYNDSFDKDSLNISIEIKADNFNQSIFDEFSKCLELSANVPIFSAFSSFLLVGSQLVKSGSEIVNILSDNKPPLLSFDFNIVNGIGGLINTNAGFVIGFNSDDQNEFQKYTITDLNNNNQLALVKNGKPYSGAKPYFIMSMDGANRVELNNFSSTLANSAMLKKFYGFHENPPLSEIANIAKIQQDYSYAKKIQKVKTELLSASPTVERSIILNQLLNAYKANINDKAIFDVS